MKKETFFPYVARKVKSKKINWSENEAPCDPDFGRFMIIGLIKCFLIGISAVAILVISGVLMFRN